MNTIRDVQSLDSRRFAGVRQAGMDLLTYANMQRPISAILGEPGQLVHSMYFDGDPVPGHMRTPTISMLRKSAA